MPAGPNGATSMRAGPRTSAVRGPARIDAAPFEPAGVAGPGGIAYSCAGSGSIVRASTGTCTSSRNGEVIMNTRIAGKASMKLV